MAALWRPRSELELSASLYTLRVRDLINLVTLPDGIEQYRNAGQTPSRGLQL